MVVVGEMSEWQQSPRTVTELAAFLTANEKATHRVDRGFIVTFLHTKLF
jgi:hypothetical protein